MIISDNLTLITRTAIYGKRYGLTIYDDGEISIADMQADITKPIRRSLHIDDVGPVLMELWERLEKEKEFSKRIEEMKKESASV